ncbi:hypothetical protein C4D60_Mb04t04350 [Musa balbisiana]|uniref:Mono-/di-acylglycerol lipase N-terminal domain-containing protein n=1 Tax=Musa balbisiana TaxID=52838 RepID=A0A4S8K9M5_MUSBA|nr:hypothetical protein C4D60_Mb04t04350 [Musa balbisiana]
MNRCSNRRRKWRKSGPSVPVLATAPSLARKRWGGHQNCHLRERDAKTRAEHEAEIYGMQAAAPLPPLSSIPFLHANHSSQALGGHQNGHRRERDAKTRAEHEAEIYGMQAAAPLPPLSSIPFLHANHSFVHAARNHFRPSAYPPYHHIPRHSHRYHPYHLPHSFNNNSSGFSTSRFDQRHFARFASPYYGGHARREEELRRHAYWQGNYTPGFAGLPVMSLARGIPLIECVYCLACGRWAWKRLLRSAGHDSETWRLAKAVVFKTLPLHPCGLRG